jgi:hypothetical protein
MGNEPLAAFSPSTRFFLRSDATLPAPFSHCILCTPEESSDFSGRVPFLDRLLLNQGGQHLLDAFQPFFDAHRGTIEMV